MLFTFVLVAATGHSFGLRPEHSALSQTANTAKFGLLAKKARSAPIEALKDAAAAVESIMLEAGNATDHMSDEDQALLTNVVDLISKTIYGSLDSSHNVDVTSIADAINNAGLCNSNYVVRIAEGGDLYQLQQNTIVYQNDLNDHQTIVNAKNEVNNTRYSALLQHMSMISAPPTCSALPEKTKLALDVYFESSDYANWYNSQKASYTVVNSAFDTANADLTTALNLKGVKNAERETSYCDWKKELVAGCTKFQECFETEEDAYEKTLKPALEGDMTDRIEAYKAGETTIHLIEYLLGLSADSAPPTDIDTSRYQLQFTPLPAQGTCKLEVLDEGIWVPTIICPEPPTPAPPGGDNCHSYCRKGMCSWWSACRDNCNYC